MQPGEAVLLHTALKGARLTSLRTLTIQEALAREDAAYTRGTLEGERRLSQQLLDQREQVMHLQTGVLASLQKAAGEVVRQSEQAMVQLALAIAEKLVEEVPVSATLVAASVRSAVAEAHQATDFKVQLHPEDLALLEQIDSPMIQPGPGQVFQFEGSPEITRGGCIVTTRFGVIDAQRETRHNQVMEALTS
jgi:flagellar assembly protein FliH